PLRTEIDVSKMDMAAFDAELKNLTVSRRSGNMPTAMAEIRKLLDTRTGLNGATIYIVSDFQQIDWGRQAAAGDSANNAAAHLARSPAAPLADWAGNDRTLRVVLMD